MADSVDKYYNVKNKDTPKDVKFIFYHIEKCGESIRRILYAYFINLYSKTQIFEPSCVVKDSNINFVINDIDKIKNNDLVDYYNLKVLLTHIYYNDFDFSYVPIKISFIRNPVERIISHYYYFEYKKTNIHFVDLSHEKIKSYCEEHGNLISNRLGVLDNNNNIDKILLNKRLKEFLFIGTLEHIDECMYILNDTLNNIYNVDIKMEMIKINVNPVDSKNIKNIYKLRTLILPYCKNDQIIFKKINKYYCNTSLISNLKNTIQ